MRSAWQRIAVGSLAMMAALSAAGGEGEVAACIRLVPSFEALQFRDPEPVLWPGYFWLWNAPLEPPLLDQQLADMAAHGARSVCVLPMPRGFRPDSTNNSMDPDYLTPEFFERAGHAVDAAVRLGMNWWLYDEGGWPSGQALGKVIEGHPELRAQRLVREKVESQGAYVVPEDALALVVEDSQRSVWLPGDTWNPARQDELAYLFRVTALAAPDLLNPEATRRFLELTHEGYRRAFGAQFGKAVRFTFTDEPGVPNLAPPESIPWTPAMDELYRERFGRRLEESLPSLFAPPGHDMPLADARARVAFYDLWTARFRDAYFGEIRDWCRRNGLASGGHLNGEDETVNAVRYGFGNALRQLRAMDVPGVDVIWRQLFPGKPGQHFFPKYASSAAHQNGTRYAFTESFCVYGSGLTPAQMKWLVDYQYVRGINLLVGGCYPLSSRDHQMTGERPHFGPMNPLWDALPGFHAYVARLGYALSAGKPNISVALYYPARDMWAWGESATEAVRTHNGLANELLARQCDFDLIDDDTLAEATVENGELLAGAMRYNTIVCGDVCWMQPDALERLKAFAAAGGNVLCAAHPPGSEGTPGPNEPAFCRLGGIEEMAAAVAPTVRLTPAARLVRACSRTVADAEIVVLFNEAGEPYDGAMEVTANHVALLEPLTGRRTLVAGGTAAEAAHSLPVRLEPGETLVFLLTEQPGDAQSSRAPAGDQILLDDSIQACPGRRITVGEHDFVTAVAEAVPVPFSQSRVWRDWLGEDYSGTVAYQATFDMPETWAGSPLLLETGPIEYAATVTLDGTVAGYLLWPPWRLELPPCAAGQHTLVISVANTLANELTSDRVTRLWAEKKGPGWPSPYHERALQFERESRGGGIQGPILLKRLAVPSP